MRSWPAIAAIVVTVLLGVVFARSGSTPALISGHRMLLCISKFGAN
jgi:hypothetical protein